MSPQAFDFAHLVAAIQQTHVVLADQAAKAVNISLTLRNWFIGQHIAEFELQGADRARYGDKLLSELAQALRDQAVSNVGKRQLYGYLAFYRVYPQIVRTASAQSAQALLPTAAVNKVRTASAPSPGDQPPIGILLCTRKNQKLVEYALAGMSNQLFVSRYQVQLPGKEEMAAFLHKAVEELGGGDE